MNEVRRTVNAPLARAIVSAIGAWGADRGAGTDRAVVVVALLLLLAALAATIFRLRLGLNFNDEPFYVALPYRFLMGDRMFIDELNYLQFSSVLTYPVVAAWVYFFGNEGIVLAMRVAYFVFASAVGLAAFLALKSRLARPLAIIAAAVIPAFIPWGIPAPSYNTVGAGFLTISLFTAYLSRSSDRSWLALIAGVAQGAATTAYPPLIVGSVGLFAAALMRGDRTRWRVLGFYAIGVGLVLLPAAAALLRIGSANLLESYRFSVALGTQGGGIGKLVQVLRGGASALVHQWPLIVALAVLAAMRAVRTGWADRISLLTRLVLPATLIPVAGFDRVTDSLGLVAYWGLAGMVLYPLSKPNSDDWDMFSYVMAPSLLAGALYAYASNNGYVNAGFGLLPAAVAGSWFLARTILSSDALKSRSERLRGFAALFPLTMLLIMVVVAQYRGFYNDGPFPALTRTVRDGAFRGIQTTESNTKFISELQADLGQLTLPSDRILFFDNFPAGYIMTRLRAATSTVWSPSLTLSPQLDVGRVVRYYGEGGTQPTVAVRLNLYGMKYPVEHPVAEYLARAGFKEVLTRPDYSIFKPSQASGSPEP